MPLVLAQIRQYRRNTILSPIFTTLEVLLEVMIPFVTSMIIDQGLQAGDIHKVYYYGAILMVMAAFSMIFGALGGMHAALAAAGFAANLRDDVYSHIQEFSFSNIDKFGTPSLVTRMTTDITNLQNAFQMVVRIAVRAPLVLVVSMIMAMVVNPTLGLTFLIPIIFLACVLTFIMWKATRIFSRVLQKYDDLNACVQENISAIRVVKAYVREEFEKEKFANAADRLYRLVVRAESLLAFNNPAMMLVVYGCIITISWLGAHFIVSGNMTAGNLTSLFSYVMSIMMSLMMLSMVFVMITMSSASIKRIREVLAEQPDLRDRDAVLTELADGSVDFDDVSFCYRTGSGKNVLNHIDLHIKSGETIGIIGGTGCGKTSLVNLISRLYDVQSGVVAVGGHDVREYGMEALRNQVAVVLQKNVLFSGTIMENLRWGKPDASEDECKRACRIACADEFIEQFPQKYGTYVDRGGANLSGGQKQRLCIARAVLKNPKVLILDDSTSAVDTATDAKIRAAFADAISSTTKLIIAQRIASVRDADRIVVMDGGAVNGIGTHDELLKSNDIYREIYESQQKGTGDFDQESESGGNRA